MPIYVFDCPPELRRVNCVDRVVCETSFLCGAVHPNGQPIIDQRSGRQALIPDSAATWRWLIGMPLPFPPGVAFKCHILSNELYPRQNKPRIVCRSIAAAATSQQDVSGGMPTGEPHTNQQVLTQPPRPAPEGQKRQGVPEYEPIDASALPGLSDVMFGENGGDAGTFADVGTDNSEEIRQLRRPPGPRPVEQPKK